MRIYFMRHAEAADGADDHARPLTEHGRHDARKLAQFLAKSGIEFDAACASPLVRARQTAEMVLKFAASENCVPLEIADALTNSASAAEFDRWLHELAPARHLLLVGHEPSISEHVRKFVGIVRPSGFEMPKGAIACVETADRRAGVLKMFLSPKRL
jgi:phosphohistidine phosphatase